LGSSHRANDSARADNCCEISRTVTFIGLEREGWAAAG